LSRDLRLKAESEGMGEMMVTKKENTNSAAIDYSNQLEALDLPISDLPGEKLLVSLRDDQRNVKIMQCFAGIKALDDHLQLIDEIRRGIKPSKHSLTFHWSCELALEGIKVLNEYSKYLTEEPEF
jgi:hypothetical protein